MGRQALTVALAALAVAAAGLASAAETASRKPEHLGYKDTPMLPGGKWHVHDSDRPQPTALTPGTFSTQDAPGKPPSDAGVLFDGADLSKWQDSKGGPARWKVENGYMEVVSGAGDIQTREAFGDCQLHVEWATPNPPVGGVWERGNSGVFPFGLYEIQVFDSYQGGIYADGQAAAVYGQYPPLVNACRKPGEWQTFDIIFTAPRFKEGKLETPAYLTMLHNGVVVHNHAELLGRAGHRILPKYTPHGPRGPIRLQAHGNPVRYRNIWIRELKDYDQP